MRRKEIWNTLNQSWERQSSGRMGFPRSVVDRAARSKGQRFCWRSNPKNPRSPLLFDTEGFEKWRQSQARLLELEVPEEKEEGSESHENNL